MNNFVEMMGIEPMYSSVSVYNYLEK